MPSLKQITNIFLFRAVITNEHCLNLLKSVLRLFVGLQTIISIPNQKFWFENHILNPVFCNLSRDVSLSWPLDSLLFFVRPQVDNSHQVIFSTDWTTLPQAWSLLVASFLTGVFNFMLRFYAWLLLSLLTTYKKRVLDKQEEK